MALDKPPLAVRQRVKGVVPRSYTLVVAVRPPLVTPQRSKHIGNASWRHTRPDGPRPLESCISATLPLIVTRHVADTNDARSDGHTTGKIVTSLVLAAIYVEDVSGKPPSRRRPHAPFNAPAPFPLTAKLAGLFSLKG